MPFLLSSSGRSHMLGENQEAQRRVSRGVEVLTGSDRVVDTLDEDDDSVLLFVVVNRKDERR